MASAWYVCPYDVVTRPGGGAIGRRCAMARIIPRVPNADGAVWQELETLGNHCLAKVNAPAATLTLLDAEPGFRRIPTGVATIPNPQRSAIRTRLVAAGFTAAEVDATGWNLRQLLRLIASFASDVRENLTHTGFEFTAGVRRGRRALDADDLDSRIPT